MNKDLLAGKMALLESLLRDLANNLDDLAALVHDLRCAEVPDRYAQARADIAAVLGMPLRATTSCPPPILERTDTTTTGVPWPTTTDTAAPTGQFTWTAPRDSGEVER